MVSALTSSPAEIHSIPIIHQSKDAPADRDTRRAGVTRFLPGLAVRPDLDRLLEVEGVVALMVLECGAL